MLGHPTRRPLPYALLAVTVGLLLPLMGCGAVEPTEYGATSAGATKKAGPNEDVAVQAAEPTDLEPEPEPEEASPTHRTGVPACELFTRDEITDWLGLAVAKGKATTKGPYTTCTWKSTKKVEGGGVVSVTKADSKYFGDIEATITTAAEARSAGGRRELNGIGESAFAIGASVSGVPIWYAAAIEGDVLTAVEMSGAGSDASVATITDFLVRAMNRP